LHEQKNDLLSTLHMEITQTAFDQIFQSLLVKKIIHVPPWRAKSKLLGSLEIKGSVTLSGFKIKLTNRIVMGTVTIAPSFRIVYKPVIGDALTRPIKASFHATDLGAKISHTVSQAFVTPYVIRGGLDVTCPSWMSKDIWKFLKAYLKTIETYFYKEINEEFKKQPLKILDLSKWDVIPLKKNEALPIEMKFKSLAFKKDLIEGKIQVFSRSS